MDVRTDGLVKHECNASNVAAAYTGLILWLTARNLIILSSLTVVLMNM